MKDLTTIGIDIAKNALQLCGTDSRGGCVLKKRVPREKFLTYMANLPKCTVGLEGCGGAHYWAEELEKLGFTVKIMSAVKVKKYVDNTKNDANDAAACAEAVTRKSMRFIPKKTAGQIALQAAHRVRSLYSKERTQIINTIRGLLLEVGIAIPKGDAALTRALRVLLCPEDDTLTLSLKSLIMDLQESLKRVNESVAKHTATLEGLANDDEHCKRLRSIVGVGSITATAVIAKIGNGSEFKKGRELSAYLGLVPKQHSSGEKRVLLGITKHGDRYIRQLLVHGGRACIQAALRKNKVTGAFKKDDAHSEWIRKLVQRVGMNKASVAVANKNARIIVALLKNETYFEPRLAHYA